MKMTVGCAGLKVRKVQMTAFLLDEQSPHREANYFFRKRLQARSGGIFMGMR